MAHVETVLARDTRTGHEAYINPAECDDCWEVLEDQAAPSDEQEQQADPGDADEAPDSAGDTPEDEGATPAGDGVLSILEGNVGQVKAALEDLADLEALSAIEEAEKASDAPHSPRKGVMDAIAARRAELEG